MKHPLHLSVGYEGTVDSGKGAVYPSTKIHTPDHLLCEACSGTDVMVTLVDFDLASLPLSAAAPIWQQIRCNRNLKPRTHESSGFYFTSLSAFFGEMKLRDIRAGHIREYQLARLKNSVTVQDMCAPGGSREVQPWKHPAGNSIINHEISALHQLLKHCGLWAAIGPYYSPLKIKSWSPREVLTEEEEEHLFTIARDRADVMLAYCVAAITNNTSAAGCELRGLRMKHLFLREAKIRRGVDENFSEVYIPEEAVKNDNRPRKISLNPTAKWAFEYCYRRALRLGSTQPDDYLFPFRVNRGKYDPKRPPSRWWIRDNWDKLRTIAGLPHLRPHDMRHQFITRALENGMDPETLRSIAGHVNPKMMEYYSHIRRQAKYAAVMLIEPGVYGRKKASVSSGSTLRIAAMRRG